jgi:glycine cleavage system H protein
MSEKSDRFEVRDGLLYTKDHEWAREEAAGVQVGITAYAVDQLGDVTLVNLDVREGGTVEAGKVFGTIESVKTLSDLYSPISGEVVRVNSDLDTHPELVNEDCYGRGWMILIKATQPSDKDNLLSAANYRELLASEAH